MISYNHVFMKHKAGAERDENLQIQVPAVTRRDLGIKAAQQREPLRMFVLKALRDYGVTVPPEAIIDRRRGKK
jgi:hypothetical protein